MDRDKHIHDENCQHDHNHDFMDIINLTTEDGEEVECGIIGTFEVEDKEYMALLDLETEDVLLFAYTEDEEGFELAPIEDDEEFDDYEEYEFEDEEDEE